MLSLKPTTPKDKSYLWKTYKTAMKPHIKVIWGWDLMWQKEAFDKNLVKFKTCLIIKSNTTVGYLQYKNNKANCFVNMLILESAHQSNGLGSAALSLIAKQNQSKSLSLKCFKVNKRAYEFYIRDGFCLIDKDEHFFFLSKTLQ